MKLLQKKEKKTVGEKSDSFAGIADNRQIVIVVLIGAIFILGIAIYFIFFSGTGESAKGDIDPNVTAAVTQTPDVSATETPTVEVLPNDRVEPEKDPFGTSLGAGLGSIRVTGILEGDDGRATAILIDGQTSYIVGAGDYLGTSDWYLAEIGDNTVTLTDGEEEITVGFEGRV